MRISYIAVAIIMALARLDPSPAAGKVLGRAVLGCAIGAVGGGVLTLSIVVARARFQGIYLDSVEDLVQWHGIPIVLTPAVGAVFGFAGRNALVGSIVGSMSGVVIGAVVGTGIGWIVSESSEAPWAGGVIGAGAGMAIGGLFLGIRGWLEGDSEDEVGRPPPWIAAAVPP